MARHLVDIDEKALMAAKRELGTKTVRGTVNEALRRVATRRDRGMTRALDTLADAKLADRTTAWCRLASSPSIPTRWQFWVLNF
jgi:Arc/MetJ family transcription regulator